MSGVKKVTDLAAKAGKAIDWDGMAKLLVSEEARKEFATLRRTFEDINHQFQTKYSQVTYLSPPPHTVSRSPDRSGQCS
jgi:F-type H+-transporting ATPase subunit d